MIILGFQFGHDGTVCVIKDGNILASISRERQVRVKHALGVTTHELDMALGEAGIDIGDVDCCTIVSTQGVEIFTGLIQDFDVTPSAPHPGPAPCPLYDLVQNSSTGIDQRLSRDGVRSILAKGNERSYVYQDFRNRCAGDEAAKIISGELTSRGWLDHYMGMRSWVEEMPLQNLQHVDLRDILENGRIKYGFHYPVTVSFRGTSIPGYFIDHHVAHAASTFYRSAFEEAAIFTNDGHHLHSGLVCLGQGAEITVLHPHHLVLGLIYDAVAFHLNLGATGGAGKLMGLAPYGKPRLLDQGFIGNKHDIGHRSKNPPAAAWIDACLSLAKRLGYDMSALGDRDRITEPVNADFAESTQKLFEESILRAVEYSNLMLLNNGIDTRNLCLSGGTALNCPSNTRILNEGPFEQVYIEPSCGDDGLAIGSALYAYHHLWGNPRLPAAQPYASPYLGPEITESQVQESLDRYAPEIVYQRLDNAPGQAARDIHENRIIAWFEGSSEDGPRALGHRSILANPTFTENWVRVNDIKQRERWRPFAPSVLEEEAPRWFQGAPDPSPYMLFNAQVKSGGLGAITHVDGSSRIQTVDESCGMYYLVLKEFFALSGVPVVLNTSFNGPGEPIVETPEQAISFLLSTSIDALYLNGIRVVRR